MLHRELDGKNHDNRTRFGFSKMTNTSTTTAAAAVEQCDNNALVKFLLNHAGALNLKPLLQLEYQHKKQQEQQRFYVNTLVEVTVQAITSIWPNSASNPSSKPIANLNVFLHHILKHSRTTHSTLQLAIFYLFRIRPRIQEHSTDDVYVSCGRRMFLAALICAHKFLQDKTYKNSAWSKVSGLNVAEINHAEKVMLQLLNYQLFVRKETYDQWINILQCHLKLPSQKHATNLYEQQIPVSPLRNSTVSQAPEPRPTSVFRTLAPFGMLSPPEEGRKRRNSLEEEQEPLHPSKHRRL
ncbi:cyclin-domain-containing protein [Radiomyces spectabilis]|uniref:cyclin-domain-containing protein n=1 Tax=Radiomyces spectabilis TaxID=64574 RepID=UPI0022208144|nr:cyclin-domain-containing protein [Radiomyces spectabilis]KAI8371651.1 cyclin-domain-containing protein [Radiomyces spectabilis]